MIRHWNGKVLKLLGLRKFGRTPQHQSGLDGKRKKMYGSMSSLPSVSSIGSRHLYGKGGNSHREGKKRPGSASGSGGRDRNINRRFQRLESHVVTLARSVAHLSSGEDSAAEMVLLKLQPDVGLFRLCRTAQPATSDARG